MQSPDPTGLSALTWLACAGALVLVAGLASQPVRAGELYARDVLTLRGGPGDGFPLEGSVIAGTRIKVLWCNSAATWCLVQHSKGQGWAPLAQLSSGGEEGTAGNRAGAAAAAGTAAAADASADTGLSVSTPGVSASGAGVSTSAAGGSVSVKLH